MRILVIEDDPALLRTLAATLRDEEYAVDTAPDGETGLYKAREYAYDAIVLDVMLPRLDGWQVLAALRPAVTTPVIMLTARYTPPDRVKGLNGGADDYLTKPFDVEELLARLRALIRRHSGQISPRVAIGEIVLDTVTRRVSHGGKDIPLTPSEYTLLEYLALHRGRVVSRTELYDHLFDEDEDTLSNVLDARVSAVRKKVGHDIITTRRGHGYCIP